MHYAANAKITEKDLPGTESWSAKVRNRARTLAEVLDKGYLELGELIYLITNMRVNNDPLQPGIYTLWGYRNVNDYIVKELGIGLARAQALRRIYEKLNSPELIDLPKPLVKRLLARGWTAVREVMRVLTMENAEHWISAMEHLHHEALVAAISEAKQQHMLRKRAGEDTPDSVHLAHDIERYQLMSNHRFWFFADQLDIVEQALQRAGSLSDATNKSKQLELICLDFLATNDFKAGSSEVERARYLAKIEAVLGTRLVAIDPDTCNIEYGLEALEALSQAAGGGAE
jgi:hypothetical protein